MLKTLFTTKTIAILSIFVLVLFLFSVFYRPLTPLPQVLNSNPTNNSQSVTPSDTIKLKFDQNIDVSLLRIESTPPEDWSIQAGSDTTLIILKSKLYFHADTKYSINLFYGNKPLPPINFKTLHQQGDPRYTRQVLTDMERDYPLAQKLPYDTSLYHVVYSAPMTLEITLKNLNLTSEEAINDIKSWVTKNGGDANAHKYIISSDNISPTPKPSTGALSTSPLR